MKKALAIATAVALTCAGIAQPSPANAQATGTFADQFQPAGGIAVGHYYPVHAPVFGSDIGGWVDRFENVAIDKAPFPGVNVELVPSLRALPVVELSLTGGKIYPREFKIPVSGTVYYKDGSSEVVATHMTVLPDNNIQKPHEPNVSPWTPPKNTTPTDPAVPETPEKPGKAVTPHYPINDGGSSTTDLEMAGAVIGILLSLAGLGAIIHLATQEDPFPGLLFMDQRR